MNDFTYEYRDKDKKDMYKGLYETYGWDNTWIERLSNKESKRVLYIGDSISARARRPATALTGEKILFDGFATSKNLDNPYFKKALLVFEEQLIRTDAVMFNNGLHGWHLSDDEEYYFYYEEMVQFLSEHFKGLPLFIVLTTCVTDKEREKRIMERNRSAVRVAEKYGLPVIDLFTVSKEYFHLISQDGVHFTPEGDEVLARSIVEAIQDKF
ncbi:MAG: hypothetical protein IJZ85_09775 [Lachnospiraceae bacterium]|nr:hypothetical protein [Lachnospiraceae bacterium]